MSAPTTPLSAGRLAEIRSLDLLALMPEESAAAVSGHLAALLARVAELETDKAHAEAATPDAGPALPWAARMADEDLHYFLGDLASAAIGYYHYDPEQQDRETLAAIEAACARWRIPGQGYRSDEPELSAAESVAKLRALLAPSETGGDPS